MRSDLTSSNSKISAARGFGRRGALALFSLIAFISWTVHAMDTSGMPRSNEIEDLRTDPEFAQNQLLQIYSAVKGETNDFWFGGYFVRSGFNTCVSPATKQTFLKFRDLNSAGNPGVLSAFLTEVRIGLNVNNSRYPCSKYLQNIDSLLVQYQVTVDMAKSLDNKAPAKIKTAAPTKLGQPAAPTSGQRAQ